jgi:hypothetical protein
MRSTFSVLISLSALLLGSCSLTSSDVEPVLPNGQLNADNTLAYHANGQPVVAHNYSNLGTVLLSIFGDGRSVVGKRLVDSTLVIRGADGQNQPPAGGKNHVLSLTLAKFRGQGTYRLSSPTTTYQELAAPYDPAQASGNPTFTVASAAPAEVVVTTWAPATRRLQGTFRLAVAAPGQSGSVAITNGRFDLVVDQ